MLLQQKGLDIYLRLAKFHRTYLAEFGLNRLSFDTCKTRGGEN